MIKKLTHMIATIWLFLFIIYPVIAFISGVLVWGITKSVSSALVVMTLELMLMLFLIIRGDLGVVEVQPADYKRRREWEI